jgi:hypothetical protein
MTPKTFKQLKQYENQWVALAGPHEEIVSSGNSLAEAKQAAKRRGYTKVIFYKVLPDAYFIPAL